MNEITRLLGSMETEDSRLSEVLLPLVYEELRRLAAQRMAHEAPGQTLQPTALVHEAWLRVAGDDRQVWSNRGHFFAAAAEAMRRILIDRARRKLSERRGGKQDRLDMEDPAVAAAAAKDDTELLAVHESLDRFAAVEPRKAELVKLRYFVGLKLEEIAEVLQISEATAKRWWIYARAWLFEDIRNS